MRSTVGWQRVTMTLFEFRPAGFPYSGGSAGPAVEEEEEEEEEEE